MNKPKDIIKLFWRAAWKYPRYAASGLLLVPLAELTNNFLPPLIAASVLERLSSGHFTSNIWANFGGDLLLYAGLLIVGDMVLWRLASLVIWKLEIRVQRDLFNRVFAHLMRLDTNFHANHFGGSLVSQANKLAHSYVDMQDVLVWEILPLFLSISFAAIILWPRAPMYVLALLAFSAVFMLSGIIAGRIVRRFSEDEAAAGNKITAFLADAITNVTAIKSFSAHKLEQHKFDRTVGTWAKAETRVMYGTQARQTFFAGVTVGLNFIALLLAVVSVAVFHSNIATVFLVVTYTQSVGQNLWEFSSRTVRTYTRAMGDAKGMVETLATEPTVQDLSTPKKAHITKGAIEFSEMSFTHADAKQHEVLFNNLTLSIPAGKKIGLVGHSGSGKTTLTRLLLRFSDIDAGAITIDGQNIAHITQDDLRQAIAYVPQEPLLFHRSLRENIAYGKPDATDDEIRDAARKAHAAEFIEKLPKGYDTEVGERGVKLSGGQRQRVAIARAILKDAPILVLDEATSALDSESERLIQAALWELMKGRTAIVIAHRLSTIQRMDEIVLLKDGAIAEQGTHEALIDKAGVYADLWAHQSGGFIQE